MTHVDCCLIFPPLWYYASVPVDLSYTGGFLRAQGFEVRLYDLSARLNYELLGEGRGFRALQDVHTYAATHLAATARMDLLQQAAQVGRRFGAEYDSRRWNLEDVDLAHLPSTRKVGLQASRNPALPIMDDAANHVASMEPRVVGVTCVHPEQLFFAPVMGRLLREAGYQGKLALYGSLEDVIAPDDFADDLVGEPTHEIFRDFDAVVIGEAESALAAMCRGEPPPNTVFPGDQVLPEREVEDLESYPLPVFDWVEPEHYPYPRPVVDLRLGRGCPWSRCSFCAIQSHQHGFRMGRYADVAEAMLSAHEELESVFFRIRDDLVTPVQLAGLADAIAELPFRARWSARMRFQRKLTREVLEHAAQAGLEELWMGLESAVPRVRALMDKGIEQNEVERILGDAHELGIGIRLLCILGFPGETEEEARETIDFLLDWLPRSTACSLTPFELMRKSPMASNPEAIGLNVLEDPLPRHERLRHHVYHARDESLVSQEKIGELWQESVERMMPVVMARNAAGPDTSHVWMVTSVMRSGWDLGVDGVVAPVEQAAIGGSEPPCPACGTEAPLVDGACSDCGLVLE